MPFQFSPAITKIVAPSAELLLPSALCLALQPNTMGHSPKSISTYPARIVNATTAQATRQWIMEQQVLGPSALADRGLHWRCTELCATTKMPTVEPYSPTRPSSASPARCYSETGAPLTEAAGLDGGFGKGVCVVVA